MLADDAVCVGDRGLLRGEMVERPWVRMRYGRIVEAGTGRPPAGVARLADAPLILPGLVDIHCHGGAGASFAGGRAAARRAGAFHAARGTTTVLASLASAPLDQLVAQLRGLRAALPDPTVAGIHLEGPWLDETHRGAHDLRWLADVDADELERLVSAAGPALRMVTLAPERDAGLRAVRRLAGAGIAVAVGHTSATLTETEAAIDAGATVATHLFNGMPPLHHREPGPALAALASPAVTCELIMDGQHVHPTVLRSVIGWLGPRRVAFVSDCAPAAGCGDGEQTSGGRTVLVAGGAARTRDGTLVGSVTTLLDALRRAVQDLDVPLEVAVACASTTPAAAVGCRDRGTLEPGARADVLLTDDELDLLGVVQAGTLLAAP